MEAQVRSVSESLHKYEFCSKNIVSAFIEELEPLSFTVQQMFVISHDQSPNRQDFLDDDSNDVSPKHDQVVDSNSLEHTYCVELNGEEEVVKQEKTERSIIFEEQVALVDVELEFLEKSEIVYLEDKIISKRNLLMKFIQLEIVMTILD